LDDCLEALEFTRTVLATRYGADAEALTIAGASAGGHLGALCMLRVLADRFSRVRSCVLFYPALDPLDIGHATARCPVALPCTHGRESLLAWFFQRRVLSNDVNLWPSADAPSLLDAAAEAAGSEGLPPTLIIHGTEDSVVPIEHSRRWLAALRLAQTCHSNVIHGHVLVAVPGGRHCFEIAPAGVVEAVFDGVVSWLEATVAGHRSEREQSGLSLGPVLGTTRGSATTSSSA